MDSGRGVGADERRDRDDRRRATRPAGAVLGRRRSAGRPNRGVRGMERAYGLTIPRTVQEACDPTRKGRAGLARKGDDVRGVLVTGAAGEEGQEVAVEG